MYDDMFAADPEQFFTTAAGPDMLSMVGPQQSVLDVFPDGTPVGEAQSAVANAVGGGSFFQRPGVVSFGVLALGVYLIYVYTDN